MTIPLAISGTVTMNGAGEARVQLGPQIYGHTWHIKRVAITSTDPGQPQFRLYLNAEQDNQFQDGSYSGGLDSSETDLTLQTLDKLIGVWTGGTAGSICTITLTGTIETAGR